MYESTPQYKIDEESYPGVLADMLNSSSSSDSSSSSGSDTDHTSGSNTTAKRIKRALRRKRRKSSASSKEVPSALRTPSSGNHANFFEDSSSAHAAPSVPPAYGLEALASGDEADTEDEGRRRAEQDQTVLSRDFETHRRPSELASIPSMKKSRKKRGKKDKRHKKHPDVSEEQAESLKKTAGPSSIVAAETPSNSSPRVGFVDEVQDSSENMVDPQGASRKPFNIRNLTVRPALPKVLSSTVFSQGQPQPIAGRPSIYPTSARATPAIRRTNSLPDRLNQSYFGAQASNMPPVNYVVTADPQVVAQEADEEAEAKVHMSQSAAVVLLLISTGLVAVCAEFLVDSIDYMVEETGLSQAFIGLIILPIVGNAAEHVTAVTVASKNKMDLALGVALGSSIQIALFVTPLIVLLGWILNTEMSLYFSLFETISLFASAFIVNYLVLDGRSNYLEGALLIAAYVIIALAAFFYPACANASSTSGIQDGSGTC